MGPNSLLILVMGGVVIAVFGWFLTGFSMYKVNRKEMKSDTAASVSTNQFWFSLTTTQQEEFSKIASLSDQERWVQDNANPTILSMVSPIVIIRELANQGRILYGVGNSFTRQHAVDYVVKTPKPHVNLRREAAAINRTREAEGLLIKRGYIPKALRNR